MSYAFDIDGGTYCGTKLLSTTPVRHYGIDNDGTNGSVRIDDGFTYNEKYQALRIMRNDAGTSPNGNNISDMLSTGPFNINRGDSVKAVFAIIAGDHVGDLQSSALSADKRYNQHEDVKDISDAKTADLSDNFPNPCSSYTNISVYMRETAYAELSIYNLLGRKVKTIANTVLPNGRHNFHVVTTDLEDGIYYYRLKYNEIQTSLKLIKMGN
jgi:hypothetical protein